MKTPITVRIEAQLLADARRCAAEQNRTLTNFIETVLRRRLSETVPRDNPAHRNRAPGGRETGSDNAA